MKVISEVILNPSLTDTPARVNMRTGAMEVSEGFFRLPKEFRVFILCHEYAHRLANTRDEKLADEIAFRFYSNLGYPLSQSVQALANVLSKDSTYHISRAKAIYDLAKNLDESVYKPYLGLKDLTCINTRKKIMRKNRNAKMREISHLIKAKKYDEARSLLIDQLKAVEPNSKVENAYSHLYKLVDKAASCVPKGSSARAGRPARSFQQMGFNDEEHFSNFCDELYGFADELSDIANFDDTFDAYAGEVREALEDTNFAGNDEVEAFLGDDHAETQSFVDDLANFVAEESQPINPFVFASVKGQKKAAKAKRKEDRDSRKQQRLDNKTKIADAKAQKKVAQGAAIQTKANAKQTLADKGISTGFKLDKSTLDAGLDVVGGALNAATGGAGEIMGKLMGGPGEPEPNLIPTDAPIGKTTQEAKTGFPMWAWIAIGVVALAAIGGGIWYFTKGKK